MKIISKEPLRVATLSGAVVLFEAGVAREVGDEIGFIALTMGADIVGDSPVEEVSEPELRSRGHPRNRWSKLWKRSLARLTPMISKPNGTPKAAVVNKHAGRTISTTEREEAWEQALNS